MPNFFESSAPSLGNTFYLSEENSRHCAGSLRMKPGQRLFVCCGKTDYECEIVKIDGKAVLCRALNAKENAAEPNIHITLYQCLPKGTKLETIIQKSVELGVFEIQPVISSRCISRPDEAKSAKKLERLKKVALSACEQSKRGIIVDVLPTISFENAVKSAAKSNLAVLFYEKSGGYSLNELFGENGQSKPETAAIIIGPEGGFSEEEVDFAEKNGVKTATLGPRILRTETAPIAALAAIMLLTGNLQ